MPQLTNSLSPQTRRRHPLRTALLLALAGLFLAALNYRTIADSLALFNYRPPAGISSLVDQTTMTPLARKILYVNHPELDNKSAFGNKCPSGTSEKTIVLGCYHGDQQGIFLLSVSDPRLNGVEDVTSAHEMLHAAYDRLSSNERIRIDAMLQDYYAHDLHDQRILDTIAAYRKSEPNDVVNEMHSIFGTEVAILPAGLQQYYQRYFTDRAQIVKYAEAYQAEFTSRQTVVKQDDAQLAVMRTQITSQQADLKTRNAAIASAQRVLLDERGTNTDAYNAAVPGYNKQVDDYNAEVQAVKTLIENYNGLVVSRNNIVLEETKLVNELNSTATPINH
jgi:hypothetical protein